MAGDFPDYSYFGFLDKFTKENPKLKQELIKQGYFTYVGKNKQRNDNYILGQTGIQLIHAQETLESTKSIKKMTLGLVIFTIIIVILTVVSLFC